MDNGDICFSYGIPVESGGQTLWEYRAVCGTRTVSVIPAGSVDHVWDMRVYGGKVYVAQRRSSSHNTTCLVAGSTVSAISLSQGEVPLEVSLAPWGDGLCLKGNSTGATSGGSMAWYRGGDGVLAKAFSYKLQVPDLYVDGDSTAFFYLKDGLVEQGVVSGTKLSLESRRYRLATPLCAAFRDGVLYAALSDPSGNQHAILSNSTLTPLPLNGYLATIRIE